MRKRPTDAEIVELLNAPHFSRRQEDATPSNDPITPTLMVVDIDRIKPYDHNPRRMPNGEYERIKESIRSAGMDQALTITRRPGDEHYMVAAGGNTRLQAVTELWHDSGDEALRQIHCLYRPWASDTDTLIAHLKENDLRDDLTFIDRALAIRELRQLIEQDLGESPSQRQFVEQLKKRGYSASRALVFWCDYAVDVLHPAIPTALDAGMGRPQIQRLRDLDRAFTSAWDALGIGDSESAQSVFADVLARHDGDVVDPGYVRRDLETELSVSADCDLQRASLVLGSALDGRPIADPPAQEDAANRASSGEDAPTTTPVDDRPLALVSQDSREGPGPGKPLPSSARVDGGGNTATESPAREQPLPPADDEAKDHETTRHDQPADGPSLATPNDIESLRARSRELATRLAHKARMGDVVVPIAGGLGFLVATVPAELGAANPPEVKRTMAIVWWHLVSVAEQFAPHGHAYAYLPPDWRDTGLGTAMRAAGDRRGMFVNWQWQHADPTTFEAIPPLNGPDLGPQAYLVWSERDWSDWVALVDTYRAIHRLTDGDPWEAK